MNMGNVASVLLVYATQLLAGWIAISLFRPPRAGDRPWLDYRRWSRALLLGPALIALQMLAMHVVGIEFDGLTIVAPWWALAGLLALRGWRRRGLKGGIEGSGSSVPTRVRLPTAGRFVLALAGALFVMALVAGLWMPVNTGDAMNQFALNARIFETHANLAPDALKALALPGHIEYPPLVSLNEALLFLAGGPGRALVIKPFFALAFLAWMLLVIEATFAFAPAGRAAFLSLIALLAPAAALIATEGYADLRLAATVLLLALAGRALWQQPCRRRLPLFALCAGACALTKLEGIPVGLAAAALPTALALRRRLPVAETVLVVLAMLALVLAWPLYARANGLGEMALVGAEWHDLGAGLSRLPGVLGAMLSMMVDVGLTTRHWGVFWLVCLALSLWALRRRAGRAPVALALLCGTAHLLIYATVLALTPADVEWHVTTAAPRLLLHVAPWALLAAALSSGGAKSETVR